MHTTLTKITFSQFEALCDEPARDLVAGGKNVRAVLTFEVDRGFQLTAVDGDQVYQITNETGEPVQYRTIEMALTALKNVAGLDPEIGLRRLPPNEFHS